MQAATSWHLSVLPVPQYSQLSDHDASLNLEAGSYVMEQSQAGQIDPAYAKNGYFSDLKFNHLGPAYFLEQSQKMILTSAHRTDKGINILRVDSSGALDTSFGTQGVTSILYPTAPRIFLTAIVTDREGRIFIIGDLNLAPDQYQPIVFRLLPDGQPDLDFGGEVPYRTYDVPEAQPDIRPYSSVGSGIIGDVLYFASRGRVVAVNLAGELQPAFNGTGYWVATYKNAAAILGGIAVNADSLIVSVSPTPTTDFADFVVIYHLTASGEVDRDFGERGELFITIPDLPMLPKVLKHDAYNDRFVLACATQINTLSESTALVRFTPDGRLDNTFNKGQPLRVERPDESVTPLDIAFSHQPSADEKIYLCVNGLESASPFMTARLDGSGKFDPLYGTDGWSALSGPGMASSVACQRNGQPLCTASLESPANGRQGLFLVRLYA